MDQPRVSLFDDMHTLQCLVILARYSLLCLHLTAGSDYRPGPYTVSFSAGHQLAVLRVSTIDDGTAELSENFTVMIQSVDSLGHVKIGSHSSSFVRIVSGEFTLIFYAL